MPIAADAGELFVRLNSWSVDPVDTAALSGLGNPRCCECDPQFSTGEENVSIPVPACPYTGRHMLARPQPGTILQSAAESRHHVLARKLIAVMKACPRAAFPVEHDTRLVDHPEEKPKTAAARYSPTLVSTSEKASVGDTTSAARSGQSGSGRGSTRPPWVAARMNERDIRFSDLIGRI